MAPRFDPESLTVELSVGDLLDSALQRHLGFANRGGYERLWLGQAIHSRYQELAQAADGSYQREVPVAITLPHRGWEISIKGRADGLRREEDGTLVVEEIKSVRRGASLAPATRQIYQRQALLYCWMLQRGGEKRVRPELVLIEIGSEVVEREPVEFSRSEIEGEVRRRLNSILAAWERERAAVAGRRVAAERLDFPYPALRDGQERIVDEVDRALADGGHLLVEAPTGLGKTVAALLPVLRHCLAHDKKVFVLTAKTLQQEMATSVIQLLNQSRAFHSLRLRAKAKMCANDQLLCHEEYCPYARDYFAKIHSSQVLERLLGDSATLLPEPIFAASQEAEVCPFEVSLELGRRSQVVVCDYNYAFDPYVALSEFGAENDLGDIILVIDEIHNLVDRGRGYYSPRLDSERIRAAAEATARGREEIHRRIAALCRSLADLVDRATDGALDELGGEARAAEAALPEDELWSLRPAFDEAFVDYLEFRRATTSFQADDPFVQLYFDLLRFLSCLVLSEGDDFGRCVEREGKARRLRILCKDPSRFLGQLLNRCHSAVGLSATLSPAEFYRDLLGFDHERLGVLSLPSPFPPEHRRVVIDDSISTLWRRRPENYPRIAERLAAFAEDVPGNCLALFPSYDFLDQIARLLQIRRKRVLVQRRTGDDREREGILEALRSALAGDVLLLAVAGGVFAEGVDYPGEMLKAVVVVGPCLPAVSLEQELLKLHYEERFQRGFEYAFVVPGMTRVVQAAGRLIRSAEDTGIIALLDERFLASPYRRHLPDHWLPPEGPEGLVGDVADAARSFFGR